MIGGIKDISSKIVYRVNIYKIVVALIEIKLLSHRYTVFYC